MIKNVEAPVDRVVAFGVFVGTDVAHASLTGRTKLECLDVWKLRLVVDLASGYLAGRGRCRLDAFCCSFGGSRPCKDKL